MGSDAASVVAAVVVIAAWFLMFVVWRRARQGGLEPEQKRRLADIRAQLDRVGGPSLTIPDTAAGSVRETYGGQLQSLFTSNPDVDERLSTPLRALARRWRSRIGPVPQLTVWLATEAVVLGVPAALVLVEVSALSTGAGVSLPIPSLDTILAVLDVGVDLIGLFPGTNIVWALTLTAFIMLYQALYQNALAIAAVLAVGAATIAHLDRQTKDSIDVRLYPRRRATARRVISRLATVWLVGVTFAHLDYVPLVPDLTTFGALLAFGLAVYYLGGAVGSVWRRLNNEYHALTNHSPPVLVEGSGQHRRARIVAYLGARKTLAALAVLMLPLIPVFIVQALTEGIWMKLDALLSSGPLVQVAVFTVVGAVVWLLSRVDPDEWTRFYLASTRAASRNAVRTIVIARGLPILAIVAAVILGLAFQLPVWFVATAALAVGLIVRLAGKLWKRLTYRARRVEFDETLPNVDVMVDDIEDGDGNRIGVARVHTHWIAWPTDDVLYDQIIRDVESYFDANSPKQSLPSVYYDHLEEVGRVDPDEVVDSVRAQARSDLEHVVAPDSAPQAVVEDRLYDAYPDRVVDAVISESERAGVLSQGDSEYYWHARPE
jgi:hypothetical protein